jgi:hypothetical protein
MRPLFIGWAVLLGLASFAVQWLFIAEFDWDPASRYAACLQNLLMSGLFIAMFAARRSLGECLIGAIESLRAIVALHGWSVDAALVGLGGTGLAFGM